MTSLHTIALPTIGTPDPGKPFEEWMSATHVLDAIQRTQVRCGSRTAITFLGNDPQAPPRKLSYDELVEGIARTANALRSLGLGRGDVVAYMLPSLVETQFVLWGAATAATALPLNPLLKIEGGDWKADGLKTGHTEEAGYGLVGSAVQSGGRRIVFVIMGLPTDKSRAEEAERIANWAFREFSMKTIAKAGTRIAEADVWLGDAAKVGLVPAQDIERLLPAAAVNGMTAEVVYKGPIMAPVTAGTPIAELVVHIPEMAEARIPLVAETDVPKGGFVKQLSTAAQVLIKRFLPADDAAS